LFDAREEGISIEVDDHGPSSSYPSFVRADQGAEHALNDQFPGRHQVRIFRVSAHRKGLPRWTR
jgi:hypothetical protein